MVSLTLALIIGAFLLVIVAWFKWQTYRAKQQAVEFEQKNAKLEAEKQQQATVIVTQEKVIKNAATKQKNIDSTLRRSSHHIDDQLQQHNWFRDDNHHGVRGVQSDLSEPCRYDGNETSGACSQSDF